jgi:hypothetical protein
MRRTVSLVLLLTLFTALSFAQENGQLTPDERQQAVEHLTQTKQKFLDSVKGLSAEQLNFKSAPDRWSVSDIAEHLALAEEMFSGMILGKIMKETPPTPEKRVAAQGKEKELLKIVGDRSQKFQAPEMLQPGKKRWASIEDTLKAFNAKRDEHLAYLKTTNDALHHHFAAAPGGTNELDAWQWFLFMSAHVARHTAQIEEVKADPKFPRS